MANFTAHFSPPSLHAPVLTTSDHKAAVADKLAALTATRPQAAQQLKPGLAVRAAAPAQSVVIPMSTVSRLGTFDAYANIRFHSTGPNPSPWINLVVDSGNSTLIVPSFADLQALPNFATDYQVLTADDTQEPWGCAAKIVRGPIEIETQTGDVFSIPNCVFYACTRPNTDGQNTANFGAGWVSPWWVDGKSGITIQAPLSYQTDYGLVEFNYAPAPAVLTASSEPMVAPQSYLTLYKAKPAGYDQMFEITRNLEWMSLVPKSLTIGTTKTDWPGTVTPLIAMVDTGGGPVFLSDPNGYVYDKTWPDPADNPPWTSSGSISCQSTQDALIVELGDDTGSYSFRIDVSTLPESVQGLTLVMCRMCSFMENQQGMNIGGLSALFNDILVDYAAGKVGFKPKASPAV